MHMPSRHHVTADDWPLTVLLLIVFAHHVVVVDVAVYMILT